MSAVNSLLVGFENITGASSWHDCAGSWWMKAPSLDLVAAAEFMKEHKARLITMTGAALPEGETEVMYHYALNGLTFTLQVQTHAQLLPSITPLFPAASWIEREIQDLYAVTFTGHPRPDRLVRPPQLEPGFFRPSTPNSTRS